MESNPQVVSTLTCNEGVGADKRMSRERPIISQRVGADGEATVSGGRGVLVDALPHPSQPIFLGLNSKETIVASRFFMSATPAVNGINHACKNREKWRTGLIFDATSMVDTFGGGLLGGNPNAKLPLGPVLLDALVVGPTTGQIDVDFESRLPRRAPSALLLCPVR